MREQKNRNNSPRTLIYYDEVLKYFFGHCNLDIAQVTKNDIFSFLDYLRDKGNASSSVTTRFRALRAFFNWCHEQGYVNDIFIKVKTPKSTQKAIAVLTSNEIAKLLSCVYGRNEIIVLLMLDCGLRKSEVLNLKVSNIFDTYFIVKGKGDKERVVPMSEYSAQKIHDYIKNNCGDLDTLISCTANAIKMLFQKLKKRTGIKRLRPHLLRHTFATLYLINGGNEISLQLILGHTSVNMVRKYVHLSRSYIITQTSCYSPLANKKTT